MSTISYPISHIQRLKPTLTTITTSASHLTPSQTESAGFRIERVDDGMSWDELWDEIKSGTRLQEFQSSPSQHIISHLVEVRNKFFKANSQETIDINQGWQLNHDGEKLELNTALLEDIPDVERYSLQLTIRVIEKLLPNRIKWVGTSTQRHVGEDSDRRPMKYPDPSLNLSNGGRARNEKYRIFINAFAMAFNSFMKLRTDKASSEMKVEKTVGAAIFALFDTTSVRQVETSKHLKWDPTLKLISGDPMPDLYIRRKTEEVGKQARQPVLYVAEAKTSETGASRGSGSDKARSPLAQLQAAVYGTLLLLAARDIRKHSKGVIPLTFDLRTYTFPKTHFVYSTYYDEKHVEIYVNVPDLKERTATKANRDKMELSFVQIPFAKFSLSHDTPTSYGGDASLIQAKTEAVRARFGFLVALLAVHEHVKKLNEEFDQK